MIFQDVRKNSMQACNKYKANYDKKQLLLNSKNEITFMCIACAQLRNNLAPRVIDSTRLDGVTYGGELSQYGNTGVWKEIPLSEVRAPDMILHAKLGTKQFILSYRHSVQISEQLLTGSHRPTNIRTAGWNTCNNI